MGEGAGRVKPSMALRADDEFGLMLFPPAAAVDAGWPGVQIPVLGPTSKLVEPWGEAAAAVLAEEGIRVEDLRIPGMRRPYFGEADRPLFVVAERFEMTAGERDELGGKKMRRTVRFDLGRGAYATVVLRALGQ
jgi:tRNA(Glu) U13 pseudouridine synthase TruD